ncbi:MAG: heparinase [Phycisphaerales bacterium]|nr:heparinase [Phycisphaerales bacterium]
MEQWKGALLARAEGLVRNRMDLFDLEDLDLGEQIDWNYEYKAGKKAPMWHATRIDYRSYGQTGDCKFVWEPNRHQHWVVLGRAYRLSGDDRFAATVRNQLDSWIEQCPYGRGMNWRSPLELAIRLINWAWAWELIRPSEAIPRTEWPRLLGVARCHLREIARKYSRYSSANNHLVGEAAGSFIASSYFHALKGASAWRRQSRDILLREIFTQTHADGGNREQAMGYHLFTLELFLLAGLTARRLGEDFPPEYWERLEQMFAFLAGFMEDGGPPPMFGDSDDGYVLDLDDRRNRPAELLAVGAALFKRSDFKALVPGCGERVFWLLGSEGYECYRRLPVSDDSTLRSRAFPDSGYYLLQSGQRSGSDAVSLSFDCGPLGFGPLAAHGHADLLSFTLKIGGVEVMVDPGTYDYFTYPRWRDYFRSTRAHNTVEIDHQNQAEMLGPFLWGRRADGRCLLWKPENDGGMVVGQSQGNTSSAEAVTHRRTVVLRGARKEISIQDDLSGQGTHTAALHLHFAEHCNLRRISGHLFEVHVGGAEVQIEIDPRFTASLIRGGEEPIFGWVARGYHQKAPALTLCALADWQHQATFHTMITIGV